MINPLYVKSKRDRHHSRQQLNYGSVCCVSVVRGRASAPMRVRTSRVLCPIGQQVFTAGIGLARGEHD